MVELHVLVQVINIKRAMMLFLVLYVCFSFWSENESYLFFSQTVVITGNAGEYFR
jgi:hypothetical protein